MNPKSSRRLFGLVLLIVAAGAAILVWRESKPGAASSLFWVLEKRAAPRSAGEMSPRVVTDFSTGDAAQRWRTVKEVQGNSIPPLFGAAPFNENVRTLITSNEIAKVDYGMLRSRTHCLSYLVGNDSAKALREFGYSLSTLRGESVLAVGDATEQIRMAAFSRSVELCRALLEPSMSDKEYGNLITLPLPAKTLAINRQLGSAADFDSPEMKAALAQAVNGPMYGTLATLMLRRLDYSRLEGSYSQDQISGLSGLVGELVLCRMGDDCSNGGFINAQLCWQNGICGELTEEAILANLRNRGLNTIALSQFVVTVQQALQSGDTSIFRKQKPSK